MSKNLVRSTKALYVPVRLRVTDNDIENGDMGEPKSCPIARSIKRVCVKGTKVNVLQDRVILTNNGKMYQKGLPEWATEFVGSFDANVGVAPLRKELDLPATVLKRFNKTV